MILTRKCIIAFLTLVLSTSLVRSGDLNRIVCKSQLHYVKIQGTINIYTINPEQARAISGSQEYKRIEKLWNDRMQQEMDEYLRRLDVLAKQRFEYVRKLLAERKEAPKK